jgi:uncharacterized membrane-anchored protein YitT (DUF2179 family)
MSSRRRHWVLDYLVMAAGAAAMAFGISALIVPARIADGGVAGLAIVAHFLTGFGVGPAYLILNVPLLAWAWAAQGLRFLWRTLVGVVFVSAWTQALAPVHLEVGDRLLAALYAGLLVGVGIGLMLRSGGSSGGVDILARYLHRRRGVPYSQTFLASDLVVLAAVALWLGLPAAMYAWIVTNVAGRVVSYVVEGTRHGRLALIVTEREDGVLRRVVRDLDRGATRLRGTGAYTGQDRPLLLVAAARHEVAQLRRIVAEEDPAAFVIVLPAAEVLGEGFRTLSAGTSEE